MAWTSTFPNKQQIIFPKLTNQVCVIIRSTCSVYQKQFLFVFCVHVYVRSIRSSLPLSQNTVTHTVALVRTQKATRPGSGSPAAYLRRCLSSLACAHISLSHSLVSLARSFAHVFAGSAHLCHSSLISVSLIARICTGLLTIAAA